MAGEGRHIITRNSAAQAAHKGLCLSDWLGHYGLFEENAFCGKEETYSMEIAPEITFPLIMAKI